MNLDDRANQTTFGDLVGASQQAISKHVHAGTLLEGDTYRGWLSAYTEKLREEAAGRGGSQQETLSKAKTEESQVKTSLNRLEYNKKIGVLVSSDEAGAALTDWAGYANREYKSGLEKIIQSLEGEHGISIDRAMVNKIAGSTTERIQSYAHKLGASLGESV